MVMGTNTIKIISKKEKERIPRRYNHRLTPLREEQEEDPRLSLSPTIPFPITGPQWYILFMRYYSFIHTSMGETN